MSIVKIIAMMGGVATTWSTTDKAAGITLSNGNLTAAKSTGSGYGVRTTIGYAGGKHYFEIIYDLGAPDYSARQLIGLFPQSTSVDSTDPSAGAVQLNSGGGEVDVNGVNVGNWCGVNTVKQGDHVGLAVDLTDGLFWARLNNGNWNDTAGADPATATGGFSLAAISGPLFPGLWLLNAISGNPQFTANFGRSAFAYTPPDGFSTWG